MRNIRPKQLNGANRRIAALRDRVHGRLNWAGNRTYRMSPAKAQFALSGYRAPPWSPKMQHLSISRVLAIVSFRKHWSLALFPPYFFTSRARLALEVFISFPEIPINCQYRFVYRLIVAIVNNGSRHTAKNRSNYIKKLRSRWQWCYLHYNSAMFGDIVIIYFNASIQFMGHVP